MSFGVSIGDILKLLEIATRVYKNCRDCPGEYKTLTNEARNLTNLLEDISDKYDAIPASKRQQLVDVYGTCVELLQELDKILIHYNGLDSKSKRAWDRLKWDEQRSRALREKLTSSVVMLNTFYTSLIHDNQVLILEALGRLERDYRGGHREESLVSVGKIVSGVAQEENEDEDDAAWPQIIRDLEDVGVSSRDVEDYRDFIVDWFVRAVNEGRLMEERDEPQSLATFPQGLSIALPVPSNERVQGMPSYETPRFPPPAPELRPLPSPTSNFPDLRSASPSLDSPTTQADPKALTAVQTPQTASISNPIQSSIDENGSSTEGNLIWTAQQIVAAWEERDFVAAETLLEKQLAAVEGGGTINTGQPDRRVLLHLIGVCASYSGNFLKAKHLFQRAFNGIYLSGGNIDDGDIAAARWLGDTCLHLNEPHNTAFAWGVALEGLTARYGTSRDLTWRVYEELDLLNRLLQSITTVAHSFRRNFDPTDIFLSSHAKEKSSLMISVLSRMDKIASNISTPDHMHALAKGINTTAELQSPRPRTDSNFAETYLVEPLVSSRAWPLQWDATFSPGDAILLQRNMSFQLPRNPMVPPNLSFVEYTPTVGLVHAKNLHYITKRDIKWLAETVQAGLREMGIEYRCGIGATLICRLNQRSDNFAFFEGIGIKFRKVQFRSLYGLKVTPVLWATRGVPTQGNGFLSLKARKGTEGFRDIIKGFLERAEDEEKIAESQLKTKPSWKSSKSLKLSSEKGT
ncbi:hypothetical protein K505DRAFT_229596 [Melanomma pulvis-pyrius CBS 109.77]|uniref:Fungal N-terminal domain-containing protein n=1 Tax=Melanomma pulvis-pyrius CBS 109.77 TaxID=1314802 RepID=A0A6A6XWW0_9PLEO|nr:hypothetical protein K505DRAFT_229596 [Melanomma pulvis-pyrius CBS 109.77]